MLQTQNILIPSHIHVGLRRRKTKRVAAVGWPAPGSEDTELGVLMELEVGHGETEVYSRVQA